MRPRASLPLNRRARRATRATGPSAHPLRGLAFAAAFTGLSVATPVPAQDDATSPERSEGEPDSAETLRLPRVRVEGKSEHLLARPPEADSIKPEYQSSATKLPVPIRETPQAVSVLTRESLEVRQTQTLGQALELAAGVTQFSGTGPFGGQPAFGFNQTTVRGLQVDDIYDFREDGFVNGSFFSVPDLAIYERIEVIKGPNSVLYGRGSPAGLINRIRKRPLANAQTEITASIGSYHTYRLEVDTTGPLLSSESLRGRLVAAYEDADSFVDGPETQKLVLAPSLSVDLSPRTRLLLHTFYQSEDIIPYGGIVLRPDGAGNFEAPDTDREDFLGIPNEDPFTWRTRSATLELEHELNDDWLATLRFNHSHIDTPSQQDAYAYSPGGLTPDGTASIYGSIFEIDRDVWSGELQIAGGVELWGREATVALGADWNENEYSRRGAYTYGDPAANIYTGGFALPDPATLTPGFRTQGDATSRGAYVQGQVRPTDRLSILAGLRYDEVRLDTLPFSPILGDPPARQKERFSDVTGRIGLTYELSDQTSLYALHSLSFTPELFDTDLNGNLLDPETGKLFELGFKSEWFDGRLAVQGAVYRIDRESIGVSAPVAPGDAPFSISSGLQRSKGYELEVQGRPLPGWDISLAYNRVNSEFKDRLDPLFGAQPGGTPDWQIGLYTAYELQSGPLEGLGLGATFFAIDDRGVSTFNLGTLPGYERLDLHLSYTGIEDTRLQLTLRNVTDEEYIEGADRPGGIAFFGAPRSILFSVSRTVD